MFRQDHGCHNKKNVQFEFDYQLDHGDRDA